MSSIKKNTKDKDIEKRYVAKENDNHNISQRSDKVFQEKRLHEIYYIKWKALFCRSQNDCTTAYFIQVISSQI